MIKRINNSIVSITSKLLFIFFVIIVVSTFTLFLWTKQGLKIDDLELFNLKFSKVYIKWNKKLHISIKEIEKTSSSKSPFSLPPVYRLLELLDHTTDTLDIEHFIDGSVDLDIHYHDNNLTIESELLTLKAKANFIDKHIFIPNMELSSKTFHLDLTGQARIYEKNNKVELLSHVLIDKQSEGDFNIKIEDDIVSISATSHLIKDLQFLNRFIDIPDAVKPWIFTKLQAKSYELNNLSTTFPIATPKKFLKNLYIKAELKQASYTFDDKLFPIIAPQANLEYRLGNLSILPYPAAYNGHTISDVKVALVDIEKAPQLQLFFQTNQHINKDFLSIIAHYVKDLPIKQFSGKNDIDFNLTLDFKSLEADVQVDAHIKDANLSIDGHALQIYDAKVLLRNSTVIIDYAKFKSFGALKTSLSGNLDLSTLCGDLKIYVSHFYTPMVKLLNDITVNLKLNKDGIRARTSTSHWKLFDKVNFQVAKHSLYLDKNETLHINKLHLQKFGFLDAHIEGSLSLNNTQKNNTLHLDVQELKVLLDDNETVVLEHPFMISAKTANAYSFESNRSIKFSLKEKPISLDRIKLDFKDRVLFTIDNFIFLDTIKASLDLYYSKLTKLGKMNLRHFSSKIDSSKPSAFVMQDKNLHFDINYTKDLYVHEPDYNITFSYKNRLHQLKFNDISTFIPYSPLLKKLTIKEGEFNILTRDFQHFNLFATINYFPIDGYLNTNVDDTIFIASNYDFEHGLKSVINDSITVELKEAIELSIENTNLDLRPFLKDSNTSDTNKSKYLPAININAENGYLQLTDDDKILYSKLFSSIKTDTIKASLFHEKGEALLLLEHSDIELYGQNFNDDFIKNLISFQGLEGGAYDFFIKGDDKKLLGGIEMKDATVKGFALYNNILSFLNTIPAIVTLNSPGFNAQGFKVNHGEIHFEKNKEIINLKQISLKGDASNVLGSGSVNLEKNTIDLSLRIFLLKDIGTIISAIPIAGHLLFGDDGSLTTTISIEGDLNDPDISIELGKDIIMAPINIIKRVIMSPVRLYQWLRGDNLKEDELKF